MSQVSVIIPVKATEQQDVDWLAEAIGSVKEQTFKNWELIVCNDSSPRTLSSLRDLVNSDNRIRAIKAKGSGVCDARNTAAEAAAGPLLLPLDADDLLTPDCIEKYLEGWQAGGNKCGIVYGDVLQFGEDFQNYYASYRYNFKGLLNHLYMPIGCLHRKHDWERVGGWKPEMKSGLEDWEYWIALGELGVWGYRVDHMTYKYRRHARGRLAFLRQNQGAWDKSYAKMRDIHKDSFNGRDPTMCAGCTGGIPRPRQGGGGGAVINHAALEAQAKDETLVQLKYVGRKRGTFFVTGVFSRIQYEIAGPGSLLRMDQTQRTGVDPRDVKWLLSYSRGSAFVRV